MASPKKLALLNLAVSLLPPGEVYLEVGTWQGKSLLAALLGRPQAQAVACDNFSEFSSGPGQGARRLQDNLARHGLIAQVRFFEEDFRRLLDQWARRDLPPVGAYFYDGAHDEDSQYQAIVLAEPALADRAVVIIDDWRWAPDSRSYAEAGTRRALAESRNDWQVRLVLPARCNGDLQQWWNGVAVLSFVRKQGETCP